jgi:hypothetical protein
MRMVILISSLLLVSCASHRIVLGEITVYGNNEQEIPSPERR